MFFKGIFFVKMQAERHALGPQNVTKLTTFKDQDGTLRETYFKNQHINGNCSKLRTPTQKDLCGREVRIFPFCNYSWLSISHEFTTNIPHEKRAPF